MALIRNWCKRNARRARQMDGFVNTVSSPHGPAPYFAFYLCNDQDQHLRVEMTPAEALTFRAQVLHGTEAFVARDGQEATR